MRGMLLALTSALTIAGRAAAQLSTEGRHFPEGTNVSHLLARRASAAAGRDRAELVWRTGAPADAVIENLRQQPMRVTVAVAQPGFGKLESAFWRVSDPASPDYGRHWSGARVEEEAGARPYAAAVVAWLRSVDPRAETHTIAGGAFVVAKLSSAEKAEALFSVSLEPFWLDGSASTSSSGAARHGHVRLATTQPYSVPVGMSAALDFVHGLHLPTLLRPRLPPSTPRWARGADGQATAPKEDALNVIVLEARDRSFQAHLQLSVSGATQQRIHGASYRRRDGGDSDASTVVVSWEAQMTPTRHRSKSAHHYLPAVNVSVPFSKYDCTQNTIQAGSSGGVLVCLVTFGPSLSLVNYIGTIFAARAVFVDGSRTPWSYFDGFGFPTQSMTVLNVRSVSLPYTRVGGPN